MLALLVNFVITWGVLAQLVLKPTSTLARCNFLNRLINLIWKHHIARLFDAFYILLLYINTIWRCNITRGNVIVNSTTFFRNPDTWVDHVILQKLLVLLVNQILLFQVGRLVHRKVYSTVLSRGRFRNSHIGHKNLIVFDYFLLNLSA